MKEKDKIKLVYRRNKDDIFVRLIGGKERTFWQDFRFMPMCIGVELVTDLPPYVGSSIMIDKISFYFNGCKALCWIDKHKNLIVRIDNINKQTKIDFNYV